MFASAFSWFGDFFVFFGFIFFKLRRVCWINYETSRAALRPVLAACEHGALPLVEGRRVTVSLWERRATMQVMLGVSLRARWDGTLVRLIKLTQKPHTTVTSMTLTPVCFAAVKVDVTADVKNIDKAARCKLPGTFSITPLPVCLLGAIQVLRNVFSGNLTPTHRLVTLITLNIFITLFFREIWHPPTAYCVT